MAVCYGMVPTYGVDPSDNGCEGFGHWGWPYGEVIFIFFEIIGGCKNQNIIQ